MIKSDSLYFKVVDKYRLGGLYYGKRINKIFDKYVKAYNETFGGYFFYRKEIDSNVQGPFSSEQEMFEAILEFEASLTKQGVK